MQGFSFYISLWNIVTSSENGWMWKSQIVTTHPSSNFLFTKMMTRLMRILVITRTLRTIRKTFALGAECSGKKKQLGTISLYGSPIAIINGAPTLHTIWKRSKLNDSVHKNCFKFTTRIEIKTPGRYPWFEYVVGIIVPKNLWIYYGFSSISAVYLSSVNPNWLKFIPAIANIRTWFLNRHSRVVLIISHGLSLKVKLLMNAAHWKYRLSPVLWILSNLNCHEYHFVNIDKK